jgi:hypothetical protein
MNSGRPKQVCKRLALIVVTTEASPNITSSKEVNNLELENIITPVLYLMCIATVWIGKVQETES